MKYYCPPSAKRRESRNRKPGDLCRLYGQNTDHKRFGDQVMIYIGSITWNCGGGYVVMDMQGKQHAVTNLRSFAELYPKEIAVLKYLNKETIEIFEELIMTT